MDTFASLSAGVCPTLHEIRSLRLHSGQAGSTRLRRAATTARKSRAGLPAGSSGTQKTRKTRPYKFKGERGQTLLRRTDPPAAGRPSSGGQALLWRAGVDGSPQVCAKTENRRGQTWTSVLPFTESVQDLCAHNALRQRQERRGRVFPQDRPGRKKRERPAPTATKANHGGRKARRYRA